LSTDPVITGSLLGMTFPSKTSRWVDQIEKKRTTHTATFNIHQTTEIFRCQTPRVVARNSCRCCCGGVLPKKSVLMAERTKQCHSCRFVIEAQRTRLGLWHNKCQGGKRHAGRKKESLLWLPLQDTIVQVQPKQTSVTGHPPRRQALGRCCGSSAVLFVGRLFPVSAVSSLTTSRCTMVFLCMSASYSGKILARNVAPCTFCESGKFDRIQQTKSLFLCCCIPWGDREPYKVLECSTCHRSKRCEDSTAAKKSNAGRSS
jgi:hypothetical protein